MKNLTVLILGLFCLNSFAQTYSSHKIQLLSHIDPQSTVGIGTDGRKYSGCWGWYQASKNKEYALVGGSSATYFIDISSPSTPTVCDVVPGRPGCTWREIKTYQHYCYVVSDDASPNRFQIIDMQYLPDSVHVILDNNTSYFERGHTIWIDNDRMYIGSETKAGGTYEKMTVYSLATPTAPVLLRKLSDDFPNIIGVVHDMFARNDTVYASCGNDGLYIFRLTPSNTFMQLGSFINYSSGPAYNHSSYITQNGKYLVFTDEVPMSLPIHIIDVQNMSNIVATATLNFQSGTTPHNPYVIGNRWAIVSSYQDGLIIYDMYNPYQPLVSGYFDTHPQGGFDNGYPGSPYRGNWGAYPFFPSGLILACDMQNGVFILDATDTYNQPIGLNEEKKIVTDFGLSPNPASKEITILAETSDEGSISIKSMDGKTVFYKTFHNMNWNKLNIDYLSDGVYIITIESNGFKASKKLIKTKNYE